MIGRLSGTLLEKTPPRILVDVNGVGYEVDVPMSTFCNLPLEGNKIVLLTHMVVREDAQLLYGFSTEAERTAFRALIKVSGIGPRIALAVLSGMAVADLASAVEAGNAGLMTRGIKGQASRAWWRIGRADELQRQRYFERPCCLRLL